MKGTVHLIVAASLALSSCAPYSFSGGRTALVDTVAVPVFENRTPEFGLPEALTRGIIEGFVNDNQIKVVDEDRAEGVLQGEIVEYKRKAYSFDETDRVKEYIVEIWVDAVLKLKGTDSTFWTAERMRGFGVYPADSTEQTGQEKAIDKLAEDILNRTIKSW